MKQARTLKEAKNKAKSLAQRVQDEVLVFPDPEGRGYLVMETEEAMDKGWDVSAAKHSTLPNPRPRNAAFKEGDVVRYTTQFLRSTGQVVGGPINGKVIGSTILGGREFPIVHWSDAEQGVPVNPGNLELDPRARKKNKGKRKGKRKRLPNAAIVPGDLVRITSPHHRLMGHQTGTVEDVVTSTVWVRIDQTNNLIGVSIKEIELIGESPIRGAVREMAKNPAEEIAAAAYAYTDALDKQLRAIRSGDMAAAGKSKAEALRALRELEITAASGIAIPSAIGAAVGGGIGFLGGAPGAAAGALLGSFAGSWLARPFRRMAPREERPALPAAPAVEVKEPRDMVGPVAANPRMSNLKRSLMR